MKQEFKADQKVSKLSFLVTTIAYPSVCLFAGCRVWGLTELTVLNPTC